MASGQNLPHEGKRERSSEIKRERDRLGDRDRERAGYTYNPVLSRMKHSASQLFFELLEPDSSG